MPARETGRRWLPGRQTLSRAEWEPEAVPAAQDANNGDPDALPYDPVYDWFDLRRTRWTREDPAPPL